MTAPTRQPRPTGDQPTTDPATFDLKLAVSSYALAGPVTRLTIFNQTIAAVEALRVRVAGFKVNKHAPVQGYSAGIPWSMHLRAYDEYCKKYSSQPALIDLEKRNCRGGFGTEELDEFIPGWRDELSETVQLLHRAEAAQAREIELAGALDGLLKALAMGTPEVADIYGPDEHATVAVGIAACKAQDILASTPADALERARATRGNFKRIIQAIDRTATSGEIRREHDEVKRLANEALSALDALTPEDVT